MAHLLERLARAAATHWKRTLALAIAGVIATGAIGAALGGEFADDFSVPNTPSQTATDLLKDRFPAASGDTTTVVFAVPNGESGKVLDAPRAFDIRLALKRIKQLPNVSGISSPLDPSGAGQVSRNGRIAFATVQYDKVAADLGAEAYDRLQTAVAPARANGQLEISMRGQIVDVAQQQSAPIGELIGVAAAVLILTLVFRSLVAMTITLFASLLALVAGLMLLRIGAATTDVPSVAPTSGSCSASARASTTRCW